MLIERKPRFIGKRRTQAANPLFEEYCRQFTPNALLIRKLKCSDTSRFLIILSFVIDDFAVFW